MLQEIASVKKRINTIGSEWVNKQSQDLAYHSERLFKPELRPQGSINMVKVLSLWFQHCFIPLPCSLSKRLLEGDFIDIYLTTFFGVRKFKNTWAIRVIFFLKLVKIEYKFIKCQKKIEKIYFVSELKASENVPINCLC